MCREGIDLVTLKVALRHSAERLQKEVDHLRQWTALASNANLAGVSARAAEACENIASGGAQRRATFTFSWCAAIPALQGLEVSGGHPTEVILPPRAGKARPRRPAPGASSSPSGTRCAAR